MFRVWGPIRTSEYYTTAVPARALVALLVGISYRTLLHIQEELRAT